MLPASIISDMVSIFLCSRTYTCISFLQNVQKCHETCQDRMDRHLSWQIKSANGFTFFAVKLEKKNKSMKLAPGSALLSFHSSLSADLSARVHLPCVTDLLNKLKNGMQTLTFAALLVASLLGCPLISGTCYLPFMWPPWALSTFHTFSEHQSICLFLPLIPSHFPSRRFDI